MVRCGCAAAWAARSMVTFGLILIWGCGGDGNRRQGGTGAGLITVSGDAGSETSENEGDDESGGTGGSDESGEDGAATSPIDTGDPGDAELIYLQVEPPDSVVEVDILGVGTQDFVVTGHYSDGSTADHTADVDWQIQDPSIGSMLDGDTFASSPQAQAYFATTLVTATHAGLQGNAQVTVAAYRKTGEQQDFFFVLPYDDPAGAQSKPLTFSTDVKELDVFINMDTTGSMNDEITNLQAGLSAVVNDIQTQVPNTQFGVGAYEDFPRGSFGDPNCTQAGLNGPDQPFELFQGITGNIAAVQTGLASLSGFGQAIGCGADTAESNLEALYQIATGAGLNGPGPTFVAANAVGIGGVGFRAESMPIIVSVTDAPSHDPDNDACSGTKYSQDAGVQAVAHGRAATMAALGQICARVVQIATSGGGGCTSLGDANEFASTTGALVPPEAWDLAPGGRPPGCGAGACCTGFNGAGVGTNGAGLCPLAYSASGNGSGVSTSVSDGIQMLAQYAPFTVTTATTGEAVDVSGAALPPGVTTADLLSSVTPHSHGAVPLPGAANPTLTPDSFAGVIPKTDVTFSVVAFNNVIPAGPKPRLFSAHVAVQADGCSELDEREVLILVPPEPLPPPG